jgi:hypothetical protein
MGPRAERRMLAIGSLLIAVCVARAQVFVVGERTATASVTTEFHPTHVDLPTQPLDERGHTALIRDLTAEQGFAHRELPLGPGLTLIANGNMTPRDDQFKRTLYEKGQSAGAGDRLEISALKFESDRIVIDFNGGPYAKHRFLSHVYVDNMQLAQQAPPAVGCRITLVFEGGMPEVTGDQVKALLDPVVDFKAHTAAEAYANTLTPKVREAIKDHQILVGMDRRMVLAAVGEPHDKHREHVAAENEASPIYEEWIYGLPPADTQFVRFRDGQVVRLEIAAIGQPLVIREHNEIGGPDAPALLARTVHDGDDQQDADHAPAPPPSLARPGEVLEAPTSMRRVLLPKDSSVPAPQPLWHPAPAAL